MRASLPSAYVHYSYSHAVVVSIKVLPEMPLGSVTWRFHGAYTAGTLPEPKAITGSKSGRWLFAVLLLALIH